MDVARWHFVLVPLLLLLALCSLSGAAEAQDDDEGRPFWMDGISIGSSMFAMVCIAYAVIDLGFKHRIFWLVVSFSALLDTIGLVSAGFNPTNPAFWLATFIGIWVAATLMIYLVVVSVTKGMR